MSYRISNLIISCVVFLLFIGVLQSIAAIQPPADPAVLLAVQKIGDEAVNTHNADLATTIITDDMVYDYVPQPTPYVGKEGMAGFLNGIFKPFPDFHVDYIRPPLVSGNIVVVEHLTTGTHSGELDMGALGKVPPTGKKFQTVHIDILEFEGDKMKKVTTYDDVAIQMIQLGLLPASAMPELKPSFTLPAPEPTKLVPLAATTEGMTRWNTHDMALWAKMVSTNAQFTIAALGGVPMSRDMFVASQELYFLAFPDVQVKPVRLIDMGGGWILNEVVYKGTHKGPYFGIPATGRPFEVRAVFLTRFDSDGLMTNLYAYFDNLTILAQLGLLQPPGPTPEETNKAIEHRVFEEIWNQGKLDVADEIFAPNAVFHGLTAADMTGPAAFKQLVAMYRAAFPDLHWTIEDQVAKGDKVATRLTGTGTHKNLFMNIPATGAKVTVTAITIVRIVNGKIQESWNNYDTLGLMQQLGVITPGRADYAWGAPSTVTGNPGDPETNKAIVIRINQEFWNQKNLKVLDETHSLDSIAHHNPVLPGNPLNFDAYKQAALMHLAAFPDLQVTNDDLIAEGDKVVVRWTATGTHKGELMGMPPTWRQIKWTGITIYRFANGKIVESWWSYDALGMMQQITASPAADYSNVFFMSLSPGLNMISPPLKPVKLYNARSFAEYISATMVIRYNEASGKFEGFVPINGIGDGFPVEGGKGYIVNVPKGGVVAFTGAAWTNTPPVTMAPSVQSDSAWAFVVSGLLVDGEMAIASDENYTVTVKNLRTGAAVAETADAGSGYFAAAWADLSRKAVVEAGDKVEIVATDSSGNIASGPFIHEVTLDEIRNAVVDMRLRLGNIIPEKSALLQNYPNPFNPETWVPYLLKDAAPVSIKIYTPSGQLVRTLDLGYKDAGVYTYRSKAAYWDGKNEAGEKVASGVYFYTIQTGEYTATKKMVITR